jgi:multiple antibiotic resistance protein
MFEHFLTIFIALLTIINPLGAIPLWLSLTSKKNEVETHQTLMKAMQYSAMLLILFSVFGRLLMSLFSLTITAIKLAGAVVILITAINALISKPKSLSSETMEKAREEEDISFTPVAMPLLVGPGTIAVMLDYSDEFGFVWGSLSALKNHAFLLVAIFLTVVITYFALRYSKYLVRVLGYGGINAMARVMAFLLLSVGMQFLLSSIKEVFSQLK